MTAGCGNPFGPDTKTYRGTYLTAFEVNGFLSCGESESWWVVDRSGQLHSQLPPYDAHGRRTAYVEVRGFRRGPGEYGHMGASRYEFVITEVITVDADTSGKCH